MLWDGIEEFVAVVEAGTFSQGARNLGLSTSMVSRQIGALEERLGVQLLKRSTRQMNLTEAGEVYYRRCSELVGGMKEANAGLTQGQNDPGGVIRITGAGNFVKQQIVPLVVKFMQQYPRVSIEIDFSPGNVDLIQSNFDLAIRYGGLKDSSLIARKLVKRVLRICGSPDYLRQQGIPQTPADLKNHNCLIGNTLHWRLQFSDGPRDIPVQGNWKCNSGTALIEAAIQGLGLVYLPEYYVNPKLESGQLQSVLNDYAAQDRGTWLVYPNRQFLPTRVELLITFLLDHFRDRPQL